jgi:hypothetical protein
MLVWWKKEIAEEYWLRREVFCGRTKEFVEEV